MEDKEQFNITLAKRKAGISRFRLLSCLMFGLGFVLVFFALYAANVFHGTEHSVPYYVGAFLSGIPVIIVACVGGAIFYKGQYISKATYVAPLLIRKVKPLILCYLIMTPFVSALCLIGLVLTGVHGFCAGDKCSYSSETSLNLGMASFLFTVELISVFVSTACFVSAVYYSKFFGLKIRLPSRQIHGAINVKPQQDQVQEALQMYTLQKWKLKIDSSDILIDFRKISEYREQARKSKGQQSLHM